MVKKRFEKVVQWEDSGFLYRPYIVFFFLTLISIMIFSWILIGKVPEWNDSFSPIGFLWIFWAISALFSFISMFKRKVHWEEIRKSGGSRK